MKMPPYVKGVLLKKFLTGDTYRSPDSPAGIFARKMSSLRFYAGLFGSAVPWLCHKAAAGQCDDSAWVYASVWTAELIESVGCTVMIDGMDQITATDGPCIFVANHMSTLETFMLPSIIRPRRPVTFVVKESLVSMPFFGAVMRSRDPIVVGRTNPREDLNAVLEGGVVRLERGISLIIFPQSTRTNTFDPQHFNSIAVKLARKAHVPLVPLALKTDAWGQGKNIKELGPIRGGMPVRYRFAAPIAVRGNGKEEHKAICDYIGRQLLEWQKIDGINQ